MNLGDNLLLQDIALFDKFDAEEALMVMRYMFTKETSFEKKATYLDFIDKLEAKLIAMYASEMDKRLTDQDGASRRLGEQLSLN